ncbi:MAG: hypothetical protein Q8P65_01015 [bacterium]|nr:hypothetical protein [bacterium]
MLTDGDISKLKNVFVTKEELFSTELGLKKEINNFKKSVDIRFEIVENAIKGLSKDFAEFKEHTYKTLDWLVGAFKKFDEEHTVLTVRYSRINKSIDNHETRISILEKKTS